VEQNGSSDDGIDIMVVMVVMIVMIVMSVMSVMSVPIMVRPIPMVIVVQVTGPVVIGVSAIPVPAPGAEIVVLVAVPARALAMVAVASLNLRRQQQGAQHEQQREGFSPGHGDTSFRNLRYPPQRPRRAPVDHRYRANSAHTGQWSEGRSMARTSRSMPPATRWPHRLALASSRSMRRPRGGSCSKPRLR